MSSRWPRREAEEPLLKDKPYRPPPRRSAIHLFVVAVLLLAPLACWFHLYFDGVVAENVVARALKPLDTVFPSSEDNSGTRLALKAYLAAKRAAIFDHRDFVLWDYFDLRGPLKKQHPRTWAEMIVLRMELFSAKLKATGDKRFLIEKDKCTMLSLLEKLKMPYPAVRLRLDSVDEAKLKNYLLFDTTYPAILKIGHIHQQKSTLFLADGDAVRRDVDELLVWVHDKMTTKFVDGSKVWAHATNPLYEVIEPCLIIQDVVNPEAFKEQHGGERSEKEANALRPLEVMVEVIWGQPMQATMVIDVKGAMILGQEHHLDTIEYLLRTDGWAAYKWPKLRRRGRYFPRWYMNEHSMVRSHRKHQETWFRTVAPSKDDTGLELSCSSLTFIERLACSREYKREQRRFWRKYGQITLHLDKVWSTCSDLATGVGADYLRCDVFVNPATGLVSVNEITLSSYWGNTLSIDWQKSVVDLWRDGYKDRENCQPTKGDCAQAFSSLHHAPLPERNYKGAL